jgi:hypothetical protein
MDSSKGVLRRAGAAPRLLLIIPETKISRSRLLFLSQLLECQAHRRRNGSDNFSANVHRIQINRVADALGEAHALGCGIDGVR